MARRASFEVACFLSFRANGPAIYIAQPNEVVNLFVGRPFQAVVTAKNGQFRRPKKGVLHFFTASTGWVFVEIALKGQRSDRLLAKVSN